MLLQRTIVTGVLKSSYSRLLFSRTRACSVYSKEQKIDVNGISINYVQKGDGPNSLLLMPGALGSASTDFQPQLEKLPNILPNYSIIAWDPPGYGKSIPPQRNFSLDFFHNDAKSAVDLMSALNRPKFSILGWSDGGITALIIAGKYKEAIDKLVIWGAGAYLNSDEVKMLEDIRDVKKWSPRMREPMEKVYGVENFPKLWSAWVDAAVAIYNQRKGDFCKQEVDCIDCPTLIVHGKKDPMIASEHIPYLREHIPKCNYHEFPEGKHNIHLRYADEFNELVSKFLLQ